MRASTSYHLGQRVGARLEKKGVCSADGSTHTESNKLYRKVKQRARPKPSSRQRPQSAPRSGGARDVGKGAGSHTPSTVSE